MIENQEFLHDFVEEASGHIESVEISLLNMDLDNIDAEEVNTIFRGVHSIKGCAGFFNLTKIVSLSHVMESLLGEVRSEKLSLTGNMVDILLKSNDCLKSMIEQVESSEYVEVSEHIEKISAFLKSEKINDIKKEDNKNQSKKNLVNGNNTQVNENNNIIANAIKEGHFYYKLTACLEEDFIHKSQNPIEFIKTMQSIGKFIELKTFLRIASDETSCVSDDLVMEFYFTTVLEERFVSDTLNLEKNLITKMEFELPNLSSTSENCVNSEETMKSSENDQIEEKTNFKEEMETKSTQEQAEDNKEAVKKGPNLAVEESIRVHISLLNDLLNLTSEMVLGRNQLLRAMENHKKGISGIDAILQNIDHITTQLQEKMMQTRMRPCSNVFNKFPRIMRDLAKKLNKEIELKLEGAEVELDKSIIEALGDPLTHLVRNSADHGLETPEERQRLGKSRIGNILIKAYHECGYVNIDVIDDGAGVNIERIKSKAVERGLVSDYDASNMTDQEALAILFKPGFSTAEAVTDVSGRGVGMDVVKTNIEKIGGTIEIFTAASKGSTFRLLLPLTLAIIPSLIVEAGGERFALPQVNLEEIVRIKPGDATRKIECINSNYVLRLRGKLLPIIHLSDVIGLGSKYFNSQSNEYNDERRQNIIGNFAENEETNSQIQGEFKARKISNILRILVIKIGARKLGLAVDVIHGSEEILVKPTPVFIKDCRCFSGVTIMGDGKTALILDPEGIIEKSNLRFIEENIETSVTSNIENESDISMHEFQNLILFRGSGEELMALDMSLIERIEEIKAKDIEKVGDKAYIKFREDLLRVVHAEDYLMSSKHEINIKERDQKLLEEPEKKMYVIIPKLTAHPIGILTDTVSDTVQIKIVFNHYDRTVKGLLGSTIINGQIVFLINLYDFLETVEPRCFKSENALENNKLKILLVEDTPFFLKLEKNYLQDAGYQVITAGHGQEALDYLENNTVDAIVSDINMPIMSGIEFVKRVRANTKLAKIPVMAITSLTGDSQKQLGMQSGFDLYEFKLDREKLLKGLKKILDLRGMS